MDYFQQDLESFPQGGGCIFFIVNFKISQPRNLVHQYLMIFLLEDVILVFLELLSLLFVLYRFLVSEDRSTDITASHFPDCSAFIQIILWKKNYENVFLYNFVHVVHV